MSRLTFQKAVQTTQFLQHAYQAGLQALGKYSQCVRLKNSKRWKNSKNPKARSFTGSINLDQALARQYPEAPRWDYGIGITRSKQDEEAIWIEVHSASSTHVKEVLTKLSWLQEWLRRHAPELDQLTRGGFYWLASGPVHITPGSRQAKILAKAGLRGPQRIIKIE